MTHNRLSNNLKVKKSILFASARGLDQVKITGDTKWPQCMGQALLGQIKVQIK